MISLLLSILSILPPQGSIGTSAQSAEIDSRVEQTASESKSQKTIKGKVITEDKDALPGATVHIKDTKIGVMTGVDGTYVLDIPADMEKVTLVYTFMGMKTKEIKYNGQKTLNVTLEEDLATIEDVVVTGYATIRKEGFSGTATTVTKEELLQVSPSNVMKALSAFDPSIKIAPNNAAGSDPNNISDYYVRGRSGVAEVKELDLATSGDLSEFSLKNDPSSPIYIVDGFEVTKDYIYDLDINRIENITILKDAVATAVYGSRAGNGVIVIETAAPAPGQVSVTYNLTTALSVPDLSTYDLMNAEEALEAERAAGLFESDNNGNNAGGLVNYGNLHNNVVRGVNTDWIAKPLRNSFSHKHYLYLNGGNKDLRWGVDLNYQNKGGVMKDSKRNTMGAAMTLDYRYKTLQIKNKASVNIMNEMDSPYGSFSDYVRMKPYLTPINPETDNYYPVFAIYRNIRSSVSTPVYVNNPLYEASIGSFNTGKYKEFIDNLGINWNITEHLLLKGSFTIAYKLQNDDIFVDPSSGTYTKAAAEDKGVYKTNQIDNFRWNLNGMLAYNQKIKKHYMNFSLGVEAYENKSNSINAEYRGFVEGVVASPSNAMRIHNKPSFTDSNTRRFGTYLQGNYTWDNIYMLDVSGRYEGSSAFGANKKMGFFWSAGTGINIHNYGFLKDSPIIDRLKIKVTTGMTGKANFNPYQARTTYDMVYDSPYVDGYGMILKALGNENLLWERVNKTNIGAELGLFKRSLTILFDYYIENTVNQVESVSIPSSSGFTSYMGNVGEVQNKGIDLQINAKLYSDVNWQVYIFGNLNHNVNRITKIGTALQSYNDRVDKFFDSYSSSTNTDSKFSEPFTKYEVGNSLTAIYGMKSLGIDPATGKEVYVKRDGTITNTWSSTEQQCLGDYEPKISGTFGFNLRWKNWLLYSTFYYRVGGQAYNNTLVNIENVDLTKYSGDRRILSERWQKPGDVTTLKDISDRLLVTRPTSRFVQNDNQLIFNSLSLGYEFDRDVAKKIGASALRLQLNTEEVFTLTSIRRERGTSYPYARTFNFSLNISF